MAGFLPARCHNLHMALIVPTSLYADYLAVRRAGWVALARPLVAPALLVAGCVALAGVGLYRDLAWTMALGAMLALCGSYALVRGRLLGALVRLRFGWCGALPVRAAAVNGMLVALTALALVVAVLASASLLVIVAASAPRSAPLTFALLAVASGFALGTAAAVGYVLRPGWVARFHRAEGIREPLLKLPWLNDACVPHLLDWQRRAALVRWRRGGSSVLVGGALVAVPHGAAIPQVLGLVLLVLSWAWLAVAMRACADVAIDAVRLLGAQPLDTSRIRAASKRYPLLAATCALVLAFGGAMLVGGGFVVIAIWVGGAVAGSLWPFVRIRRATRPGGAG